MTEQWARVVRRQVGLGRLLPLGGARDGAWITEDAAADALRRAVRDMAGARLGALRIAPAGPGPAQEPVVPAPPSALPPGPLRVTADFSATAVEPLPTVAARLRDALGEAASGRLGLTVTEIDLRVTALLDESGERAATGDRDGSSSVRPSESRPGGGEGKGEGEESSEDGQVPRTGGREAAPGGEPDGGATDEARVATAALAVPGVTGLTGRLGGLGRAVHIDQSADRTDTGAEAVPRRHVRVEIAVDREHRTVEVARQVRSAVGRALPGHPSVAVLVTAVG
ncbi:nucleopolyhedrovirus P10 family protein [Streptomyces sp. NPDC048290]|uniref:nucleopolyhedrovirus P10 family protein n=1 Tax=Streptomyces sp. NPDC048290 TaxID=3155811 RepID=UPI003431C5C1